MRRFKDYLMATLAFLTCPCHLPLLLVLLAGTSAGAWLGRYQRPIFWLMVPLFVFSLYQVFMRLGKGGAKQ